MKLALSLTALLLVATPVEAYRADVVEARQWLRGHMAPQQFRCLHRLWTNESHWRVRAGDPRHGAYGIVQAYPGRKMRSAGRDWRTNAFTQIRWGRRYIRARYGSACAALRFQSARGWY